MTLRWLVVGALLVAACGGGGSSNTDGGAGKGGAGTTGGAGTGAAGTTGGAGTSAAGTTGGAGTGVAGAGAAGTAAAGTGAAGTGAAGTGTDGGAGTGAAGAGTDGGAGTGADGGADGGRPVGPFTCTPATQELVPEAGATGARLCFQANYTGGVTSPPVLVGFSCALQTALCPSGSFQLLGFDIRTGLGYARTATNDPVTKIRSATQGTVANVVTYYEVTGIPLATDVSVVVQASPYWTAGYGTDDFTVKTRYVGTTVTNVIVERTAPPAATDGGGQ